MFALIQGISEHSTNVVQIILILILLTLPNIVYLFRSPSGQTDVHLNIYGFQVKAISYLCLPTDKSDKFVCSRTFRSTNKKNTQFIFLTLVRIPSRTLVTLAYIPSMAPVIIVESI